MFSVSRDLAALASLSFKRLGLFWGRFSVVVLAALASAHASVDVREVVFNYINLNGSRDRWLECELQLEVRRDAADRQRKDADYLDDLEVVLMLGVETQRGNRPSFEFYSSRATLVSLEEGKHVTRFYLPPEIVERDRMRGGPHTFLVRLARKGRTTHEFHSASIERATVKANFLKRIETAAPKNEGILLPQNRTPFIGHYPGRTPSYRENRDAEKPKPDS